MAKKYTPKEQDASLSDYVFGKVQPQAVDLEAAVLGALMLDKNALSRISHIIRRPDFFYTEAHQSVYEAILSLDGSRTPIDLLTVTEALKKAGKIESVGGAFYLVELTGRVGSSANIEAHSRIIQEKWIKRKLIEASSWVIKNAYEDSIDVFELIDGMNNRLREPTDFSVNDYRTLDKLTDELLEVAKKRHEKGGLYAGMCLTGIHELEEVYGGGEDGDVIVISGSSGSGKSSLFNNIICESIKGDRPIYSWSKEMSKIRQTARVMSAFSGINSQNIRSGSFLSNIDMKANVEVALGQMRKENVIMESGTMNIRKIRSTISLLSMRYGIKVFLWDRLELFDLSSAASKPDDAKELYMNELRGLSAETGCINIIAAQMAKTSLDKRPSKRPQMEDITGSSAIFQAAMKILLVYRPELHGLSDFPEASMNASGSGNSSALGRGEIIIGKNSDGIVNRSVIVDFNHNQSYWGDPPIVGNRIHSDGFWPDSEPPSKIEPNTSDRIIF